MTEEKFQNHIIRLGSNKIDQGYSPCHVRRLFKLCFSCDRFAAMYTDSYYTDKETALRLINLVL